MTLELRNCFIFTLCAQRELQELPPQQITRQKAFQEKSIRIALTSNEIIAEVLGFSFWAASTAGYAPAY